MKNKEKYNLTELAVMSDLKKDDYRFVKLEVFDSKDNRVYKTEIDLESNKASLIQDTVMDYYNEWLEAEYIESIRLTRNEKATPKKLIDMSKESYDTIGVCPNCRTWCYMEYHSEYCGECGQALDWSEEDD